MLGYKVGHYFYDATAVFKNAEGLISCTFDDDNMTQTEYFRTFGLNRIFKGLSFMPCL